MERKYRKLAISVAIPVGIFLFNILLVIFGVYGFLPWMDIPMHFLGGASIAYFFICLTRAFSSKINFNSRFFEIISVISFVSFIAVLWEFYEFLAGSFLPNYFSLPRIGDTLLDLFFGITGAFFVSLFVKIRKK